MRHHGERSEGQPHHTGTSDGRPAPALRRGPGTSSTRRRRATRHGDQATTSPAVSPNAATGKGIAGTQPGHGSGTTGKAGAPGQLKTKPVHAKGHVIHSKPVKPKVVHTAPVHPVRPVNR